MLNGVDDFLLCYPSEEVILGAVAKDDSKTRYNQSFYRDGTPRLINGEIHIQFWGFEVVLQPDNTYLVLETDGG